MVADLVNEISSTTVSVPVAVIVGIVMLVVAAFIWNAVVWGRGAYGAIWVPPAGPPGGPQNLAPLHAVINGCLGCAVTVVVGAAAIVLIGAGLYLLFAGMTR